nr:hypothetical protein [Tanacetum cinerariifolium]
MMKILKQRCLPFQKWSPQDFINHREGIVHYANLDFASLIQDEFEWQTVERSSRPSKMSKLLYTHFTKLIIDYIVSHNKSISYRSDSKLNNSQDDQLINKLLSITNGEYNFGVEVLDAMISDAIKKKIGYTYYMAKKVENANSDATLCSSSSDKTKESANETDDDNESDMDIYYGNQNRDDNVVGYGVFMHNKSTATPNSTYLRMSVVTEGNVYLELRINLIVRVVVKKKWGYVFLTLFVVETSDDKEYEFSYADLPRLSVNDFEDMYLLQVKDKLHHLPVKFVKDFNNALLMLIRRTVIKNRVEDI